MNEQELAELFNEILANNTTKSLEFRLYYDTQGNPLCYACEDLPGDYIVIDQETYAQGRYDVKIIDGEITPLSEFVYYNKITPSNSGTACRKDNALIVDPNSKTFWSLKTSTAE